MAEREPAWPAIDKPPHPHDSAHLHVSGAARYCDDEPEPANLLHLAFGLGSAAHAIGPSSTTLAMLAAVATPTPAAVAPSWTLRGVRSPATR